MRDYDTKDDDATLCAACLGDGCRCCRWTGNHIPLFRAPHTSLLQNESSPPRDEAERAVLDAGDG